MLELNKKFIFSLPFANSYTYYIHVKTKAQFDHYNFDRFVEEKIEANKNDCFEYIQTLIAYRNKYDEYKAALSELPSPGFLRKILQRAAFPTNSTKPPNPIWSILQHSPLSTIS